MLRVDGYVVDGGYFMGDGVGFAERVSGEVEEVVVRIDQVGHMLPFFLI